MNAIFYHKVLEAEITGLIKQGYLEGDAYPFSDINCLKKDIKSLPGTYQNTLIIPYSWNTEVEEIAKAYKCIIPDAENCIEILIGKEEYRKKLAEGYYFLLPGELHTRAEFKKRDAGMIPDDAIKGIIYLDTGAIPVNEALLQDFSHLTGVKIEIYKTSPAPLALLMNSAILKAKQEYCARLSQLNANYALIAEMHKKLVTYTGIDEIAKKVLETILILTACKKATIAIMNVAGGYECFSILGDGNFDMNPVDSGDLWEKILDTKQPVKTAADAYMLLPLVSRNKAVGLIEIKGITFTERIPEYEETLLPLTGMIASTLENAYLHEKVSKRATELSALNEALQKEVSERKRVEDALQKSESEYRLLFESNPHPMWVVDCETLAFLVVNDAAVLHYGYSREEFLGMTIKDIRPSEDVPHLLNYLAGSLNSSHVEQAGIWKHRKRDGTLIDVEITKSPISFKGKKAMLVLANDVTERKKAEEELRKQHNHLEHLSNQLAASNKELEAFCYSVSHDLRAPLRRIEGFSKALIEEYSDRLDIQGKNYVQRARMACRQMAQLIEDLLNLSQVTRSQMHRNPINLSALAMMIARDLQGTQPDRQVEFSIAEGLIANGDQHLLRIALENLLGNAWKFTRNCSNARIEFGITQHGGKSAYFVRDNGAGFDMVFVNKLFGAFQRLHSANEFEGTGIGLATVQRIIHRHGGHVWAEGEVGKGATFYFTI